MSGAYRPVSPVSTNDSTIESAGQSKGSSSTLKWVLLAVAVVIIVIATVVMVSLIFIRINQLDKQIQQREDTLAQLKQQKQITSTEPNMPIIPVVPNPERVPVPEAGQSISFSRSSSGSSTYTVRNWLFDDWVYETQDYDVLDNAFISINTEGIYTIQAQVSFRMKSGMATYQIKKKTINETAGKSLSQCIKTFDKKYSQIDSCFTSITTYLKPGDQIYVDIFEDNFTVDFRNGKSTFSVMRF